MRFVKVRPNYFRAFGSSDWISLDADLVVLYGPNGSGKTSLTEAIEWLLYGKTKRRERGEVLSQRDYFGSYRNAHAPATSGTSVEAVIRLSNGTEHLIRRQLGFGPRNVEICEMFVDGNAAPLAAVGIDDDEVYSPIVAQDSLQDFIHSKPKDRRDKISAALGMEALVRFKTVADRARTRLQSDPPQTAVLARTQAERIVAAMRQSPRVSPIADRWTSSVYDRKRDSGDLCSATLSFLGLASGDWSAITVALEQRREDAARRIFDDSPIRVPANLQIQRQELQTGRQAVLSHVSALATAFDALVGTTAAHFSQAKLQFWQTGLALTSVKRQDECPMCEARTLTTAKRSQLEQRIKQSATYTSALANLRRESKRMSTFLRELARLGGLLFPKFLSAVQRSAMKGLFTDYQQSCDDFLSAHDATRTNSAQANQVLIDLASQIEAIPDLSTNPETVHIARDLISNLHSKLEAPVQCADQAATNYARAHVTFNHQLHQRIASTKTIQEIDGLLAPITGWQHIEVVAEYVQLLADSLEVVRQIEAHIQAKQAALFASRGREINNWYDLMNPGAAVRYKRMEAGTDNLSLWAESYGVEINAVACLSQCQLNCLGLSIHFVRALTSGSPFAFLLLDDPVQSMDDEHCQSLVAQVIQELLKRKLQVVVCSHVQGLVDQMWETYYHGQPLRLRISDFGRSGPVIENAESLQQAVQRAQQLACGNEDHRRLAIKVLRRSVELLIRAVCLHTASPSPPHNANASTMLPFLRACPGVTPQQVQGLEGTVKFANPGPHTHVGWAVPTKPQMTPHIDRVRQTATQLQVW